MADIINTVSDTTVTVGTERVAVRVPEQGGLLAYLVNPGTQIDLSAIDFKNSALEMDDGNLRITLPNNQGEILLLDMQMAAQSDQAPTLLFSDGSTVTVDAMLNALAAAEQDQKIAEVEPAAGPETISQVQESSGYTVPGIVGDTFGDNSSVISDVIGPFTIHPAFDEINGREIILNTPPAGLAATNPDAVNDAQTTPYNTPVTISVLANDTDPENDPLSITGTTSPSNGSIVVNANGTITYTPNSGFSGTDTFTYTITDGNGGFDTATVTVTVDNAAPDAVNDNVTSHCGDPVTISVLSNDTDPNGDTLTVTSTTAPANGTVVINANGTITYTPNAGYCGTDTFTYTISDGHGGTDTATVTVTATNTAPDAVNDAETTPYDTPVTISVLANDTDPENDSLSVTGTTNPSNGSILVNANGTITYTPNSGFSGTDTFTYTISDGHGGSDTATVTVTVENAGPDAVNDTETTPYNTPVTITVLNNDTDDNGDPLSVTGTTNPSNGSIVVNANGTITYTPNSGFSGTDTFTYTITDGNGGYDTATVTVTVDNAAPDAVNDTQSTPHDTPVTISVLTNDTDPNGDPLSVTGTTNPSHGSVTVNTNGTITYTPDAGYCGTDSFTYTISDGNGGTDTATVNLTVTNSAPDAVANTYTIDEDTTLTDLGTKILANDTDPEGDSLTITHINGTALTGGNQTIDVGNGVVNVVNGVVTSFTPDANWNGTQSFNYTIEDDCGATDTTTVTVIVNPVNDAPDAVDDPVTSHCGDPVIIAVLNNDSDPDGDPLTVTGTSTPAHGSVVINANGTITYTPDAGYCGPDSFTYTISDGNGGTDTATVDITMVNNIPDAVNDSRSTPHDTPIVVDVLTNDSDPDGDPLSVTGTTNPSHGSIKVNANGTITYTPDAGYCGTDSFTYTISDGHGGTDTATVKLTVTNTAPDAVNDAFTIKEDQTLGNLGTKILANDTDPEGDKLTITHINGKALTGGNQTFDVGHGIVTVTNGVVTSFTPDAGWNGTESFTYTIQDDCGKSDTATVKITVNAVNDAPTAKNDSATTHCGDAVVIKVLTNDSDPDGDALKVNKIVDQPNHGSVKINANGTITYTPADGFTGKDTFQYQISDGHGGYDTATVTVNVTNDAPIAKNDSFTTKEDTAIVIKGSMLSNDSDPDGDNLTITHIGGVKLTGNAQTIDVGHGKVVVLDNGNIKFVPDANWHGTESFNYTVADDCGKTDTAKVTVNVTSVNDAPDAKNDTFSTHGCEPVAIKADMLSNDSDPDGDKLSITHIAGVKLTGNAQTIDVGHGKVVIANNGSMKFIADDGFSGKETFNYRINDGHGGTDVATVTINVQNAAPNARNDVDNGNNWGQWTRVNVLANDSDPDGDKISVTGFTNVDGGQVRYLGNGIFQVRNTSDSKVTFDYTIEDDCGKSDSAHVTVRFDIPTSTPGDPSGDGAGGDDGTGGGGSGGEGGGGGGRTPLVLDLDGDGIELISLGDSHANFDMDNDGSVEHTAWVSSDDGFLVMDRNGDGIINDRSEMFGDMRGADHGFEDLALLDDNGDNIINSDDAAYNNLQIWQDVDGDGVSEDGELFMLSDLGITSISLDAEYVNETNNGQWVSHRSTFTYEDGTTQTVDDVWFESEEITTTDDASAATTDDGSIATVTDTDTSGTESISTGEVLAYNSGTTETTLADDVFTATDTGTTDLDLSGSSATDTLTALGVDIIHNPDAV